MRSSLLTLIIDIEILDLRRALNIFFILYSFAFLFLLGIIIMNYLNGAKYYSLKISY